MVWNFPMRMRLALFQEDFHGFEGKEIAQASSGSSSSDERNGDVDI